MIFDVIFKKLNQLKMNSFLIESTIMLLLSKLNPALADVDPLKLNCLVIYDESKVSLIQLYLHDASTAVIPLTLTNAPVMAMAGEINNNLLEIYYSTIQEEFAVVIIDEVETYEKKILLKGIGIFAKPPLVPTVYYFDKGAGLSSSSLVKPKTESVNLVNMEGVMCPLFFEKELLYLLSKSGSGAKVTAYSLEKNVAEKEHALNILPYKVWMDFQRNEIFAANDHEIYFAKLNSSNEMKLIYKQNPLGLDVHNYIDVALGLRNLYVVNSTHKVYRIIRRNYTLKPFATQDDEYAIISRIVLIQDRRNGTVPDWPEEDTDIVRVIPRTTPKIIIPTKPRDAPFVNIKPKPLPIRSGRATGIFHYGERIMWIFNSWLPLLLLKY